MDARALAEQETACYLARDWGGMRKLYADKFVFVAADGSRVEGADAYLTYLQAEDGALGDADYTDEIVAVDGPVVVQTFTMSGTFDRDLTLPNGEVVPASGAPLRIEGCAIARVDAGRFVFAQRYYDRLSLMQQLGLIPS